MSGNRNNRDSPAGGRTGNTPSMTGSVSPTTARSPMASAYPNTCTTDEQKEEYDLSVRESRSSNTFNSSVPSGSRVSTGGSNGAPGTSIAVARSQSFDRHTQKARREQRNDGGDAITSPPSSETRPSTSSSSGNTSKRKSTKGRTAGADVEMADTPDDKPASKKQLAEAGATDDLTTNQLFTPDEQRVAAEQKKVAEAKERARQAKNRPPTKGKAKPKKKSNPKDKRTRDNDPEDPGDESDDGRRYCICRSSDTSGLMVACEGKCGDWYHARCVGMRDDISELIMRFYCPDCTIEDGIHQTLWNSKCVVRECPKARRGDKADPTVKKSKFCSNEHATLWVQRYLARFRHDTRPSLGGRLNLGELKAMLQSWEKFDGTWEEWRKAMQPGKNPSFAQQCFFGPTTTTRRKKIGYTYEVPTVPEDVRKRIGHWIDDDGLERIAAAEGRIEKHRIQREGAKVMQMALRGSMKHLSAWMKENPDHASICGSDYRLARDGEEWILWLATSEGQKLKETGVMPVPAEDDEETKRGGLIEGMCSGVPGKCMHGQWFSMAMDQTRSDIAIADDDDVDDLRAINRVWDIALTYQKREDDPTLLPKPSVVHFPGFYTAQGLPVPEETAAPPQAGTTIVFPNRR